MPTILNETGSLLALDVGTVRIGVAVASTIARLPRPLTTLLADDDPIAKIAQLIKQESVVGLVVGRPRNLNGESTAQTAHAEAFAEQLKALGLPVFLQDEALTSRKAEAELEARGKMFTKADVDALAAAFILEDFIRTVETGGTA